LGTSLALSTHQIVAEDSFKHENFAQDRVLGLAATEGVGERRDDFAGSFTLQNSSYGRRVAEEKTSVIGRQDEKERQGVAFFVLKHAASLEFFEEVFLFVKKAKISYNEAMKICYISNSRIPTEKAHGIQIMKTCEALAEDGVGVELVLPSRKNRPFKGVDIFSFYDVAENFKIKKIWSCDPTWLMRVPNGIYIKVQLLFFLFSLFIFLLYKRNKKDYIFYTRDEYLLPMLLNFSRKVFWEAHSLPQNSKKYLRFWQRCAGIVAITQGLKKDLINLGMAENKIMVAPDAVDVAKFQITNSKLQIREKLNLPVDKKIVMYTGHLYGWKGVQTLAEAAEFLDKDIIVVFVGGTDFDLDNFKNKNNKLIENGKILLLGQRPPKEVPEFLVATDCLALPNSGKEDRSEKHTSPMKLFEYMAAGKPIVASDLPSIREVLNENNVTFFKADSADDLAEKIKQVLENQEPAQRRATQAKEDAKNYTWQKRVEKIISFLKNEKNNTHQT